MFLDSISIEDVPITLDYYENPALEDKVDASFIYTLEVLLKERTPEFNCEIWRERYITALDISKRNSLFVIFADNGGISIPSSYREIPKFKKFFESKMNAELYIDQAKKTALVFLHMNNGHILPFFHFVQSAIPIMLPWYFEGENHITDEELRFLKTLTRKDGATEYTKYIKNKLLDKEARIESIKRIFKDFFNSFIKTERVSLERKIKALHEDLCTYQSKISSVLKELSESEMRYTQLQLAPKEEATDIQEYMINNLDCIKANKLGCEYEIVIDSYFDNYDEDMLKAALQSRNSALSLALEPYPTVIKVIKEIFLNHKARLKARSCFIFSTYEMRVSDSIKFTDGGDRILNPHHLHFGCLGGFTPQITEAIRAKDYITAIELARVATGNINFMDGAVIPKFVETLANNETAKCVEMQNGSSVTIKDFYDIIREGEKDE